jgi:hypothetical protein
VRPALLAHRPAAHVELARHARQRQAQRLRRRPVEERAQAQLRRRAIAQLRQRATDQARRRAVGQGQLAVAGEDEERDVDGLHHLAHERAGLERAVALGPQRRGQRVGLAERHAERVVVARVMAADGEVALAQRRQKIGQRLQRARHLLRHPGQRPPAAGEQQRQGPAHLGRVRLEPQQRQRHQRRRHGRDQRVEDDARLVAD